MNIINSFFSGGNVFVNGRPISGLGKPKKFDETKSEEASKVKRIAIDLTFCDVNVSVSNVSNVEAHFYGEANVDGDVEFEARLVNNEFRIKVKFTGNCYNGKLKLDVTVPEKTFKTISVNSSSANIVIDEKVSTDLLKVKTQSGAVETYAMFTNASINTMSGDVDVYINANKDIVLDVSTMSGHVSVELNNIKQLNLSTRTMSGSVRNRHISKTGYCAEVDISTMSGAIKIR